MCQNRDAPLNDRQPTHFTQRRKKPRVSATYWGQVEVKSIYGHLHVGGIETTPAPNIDKAPCSRVNIHEAHGRTARNGAASMLDGTLLIELKSVALPRRIRGQQLCVVYDHALHIAVLHLLSTKTGRLAGIQKDAAFKRWFVHFHCANQQ